MAAIKDCLLRFSIFLLVLLQLCCNSRTVNGAPAGGSTATRSSSREAKRYIVNLDLEPEKRWTEIASDFNDDMRLLMNELHEKVPVEVIDLVAMIGKDLNSYLEAPYAAEIAGIAATTKIDIGLVLLGNILYEVTAFGKWIDADGMVATKETPAKNKACTSIVAESFDETIYHGRNLDYSFLPDTLRNMTIVVDFQRGGVTQYTGTTYAGFIGLLTGQKPHAFTVTMDERDKGDWWMNALQAIVTKSKGVTSFFIRNTLEQEGLDFQAAVTLLANSALIAPSYIIVGGLGHGEGVVITRDRIKELDVWNLNASEGRWFLVETNYDHWKPPPSSDDRRDPAIKAMNEEGRKNLGKESLFKVLSTPPVLNNGTTYTVTMSASQPSLYTTWIRYP